MRESVLDWQFADDIAAELESLAEGEYRPHELIPGLLKLISKLALQTSDPEQCMDECYLNLDLELNPDEDA